MKMNHILDLIGNVQSKIEVKVSFIIPGKIIRDIFVDTGDLVTKGDKIAVLEKDAIRAKVEQVNAAMELAKANLKQAETNLDILKKDKLRMENLYKEKAVARQKLDHIVAQYKVAVETEKLAQAGIKQAKAAIKEVDIVYREHTLYAPVSGYVAKRYVDKGSMSAPTVPVVQISREDALKIVASATGKDFLSIDLGMPVEISVDSYSGKIFKGKVTILSPTIDPTTRTGEIEIHFDNKEKMLRSGMFARIKLFLGQKESTVVLRDSLLKLPGTGSYYVYVVENGKAVQKNIKIGIGEGNFVEVISGLGPGEQVVLTGQGLVKEGVAVVIDKDYGASSIADKEARR
jgi:HlyD family secretion protein